MNFEHECNKMNAIDKDNITIKTISVAANLKNNMVGQCQQFVNIKIIVHVEVDKKGYYNEFLNDSGTV